MDITDKDDDVPARKTGVSARSGRTGGPAYSRTAPAPRARRYPADESSLYGWLANRLG